MGVLYRRFHCNTHIFDDMHNHELVMYVTNLSLHNWRINTPPTPYKSLWLKGCNLSFCVFVVTKLIHHEMANPEINNTTYAIRRG